MIVFIIDLEGKQLLPTNPMRARRLLAQGKATVKRVVPFTIQLNRVVENPVGSFEFGVDDGSKYVGLGIKNLKTEEIVFHGQMDHRQDVSRKMEQRKMFRSQRRSKLRFRARRFNNRIKKKIPPSIRQRKEAILRVIKDLEKYLNLIKVCVEEVVFNHYEKSYGRHFSLVEVGKTFLREQIECMGLIYEKTSGWETSRRRKALGLSKSHSYDACAILGSSKIIDREYFIKPKRTKKKINNPTKKYDERNGFHHYDLIKAKHKTKGIVIGSINSLCTKSITVRTKFSKCFMVSYKKSKLLYRFKGLIYFW